MSTVSIYLDHKFDLVTLDGLVYAPAMFERFFDTLENAEPTTAASALAAADVVRAVKTAQLVAERLAGETGFSIADLGNEFVTSTYVRAAGRSVAATVVPTLQALTRPQRVEVAARAVDPTDCGEDLDLVLDGVGRMLSVYGDYLPNPRWVPVTMWTERTPEAQVVGWCGPDGAVVLDLLDTFGPGDLPEDGGTSHRDEVADVMETARGEFGAAFAGVRYLPTFDMRHARVYYPNGCWDPYLATPLPALRLVR